MVLFTWNCGGNGFRKSCLKRGLLSHHGFVYMKLWWERFQKELSKKRTSFSSWSCLHGIVVGKVSEEVVLRGVVGREGVSHQHQSGSIVFINIPQSPGDIQFLFTRSSCSCNNNIHCLRFDLQCQFSLSVI